MTGRTTGRTRGLALGALVTGLLALGGLVTPGTGLAAPPRAPAMPGPVLAHNVLIGSDPSDGARLETGPARVTLRFDLPVQQSFNTVTVVGPDGGQYQDGAPTVDSATVTAAVRPLGPAGHYTIGYRVVSDDGHPVSGKVSFTLVKAGAGTPSPASATPDGSGADGSGAAAGSGAADGGMPAWPWVLGAVLLVGAGAAVALRTGKS